MKTLKVLLAVVGMVSATIASSSSLQAKINPDSISAGGHCANSNATCGRTSQGTTLYGSWYE